MKAWEKSGERNARVLSRMEIPMPFQSTARLVLKVFLMGSLILGAQDGFAKKSGRKQTRQLATQNSVATTGLPRLITYRQLVWLKPAQRRQYLNHIRIALLKMESTQEKALERATSKAGRAKKHAQLEMIREWIGKIQLFEAANAKINESAVPTQTVPDAFSTNRGQARASAAVAITANQVAGAFGGVHLEQREGGFWQPICNNATFYWNPTLRRCSTGYVEETRKCNTGTVEYNYKRISLNANNEREVSEPDLACLAPDQLRSLLGSTPASTVLDIPVGPETFATTEEGNKAFESKVSDLIKLAPESSLPPAAPINRQATSEGPAAPVPAAPAPAPDVASAPAAPAPAAPATPQTASGGDGCSWKERTDCPKDSEAARQEYYNTAQANPKEFREQQPYCIYSGNFSTYKNAQPKPKECKSVSEFGSGEKKLTCPSGKTLCNPFLYGVQADGKAVCTKIDAHATVNCAYESLVVSEKSYESGGRDKFKDGFREFKLEDMASEAEWNEFRDRFHEDYQKLCFPKSDAVIKFADFFCEECNEIGRTLNYATTEVAKALSLCLGALPAAAPAQAAPAPAGPAATPAVDPAADPVTTQTPLPPVE
jgi:hypothetical protein